MSRRIINVEEEEKIEKQEIVEASIDLGNLGMGGEFDELGLDNTFYARNQYDYVLFPMRTNMDYPLGTAFARAYGALKSGGKFIVDTTGAVVEEDFVIGRKSFFEYDEDESKKGFLVFTK